MTAPIILTALLSDGYPIETIARRAITRAAAEIGEQMP